MGKSSRAARAARAAEELGASSPNTPTPVVRIRPPGRWRTGTPSSRAKHSGPRGVRIADEGKAADDAPAPAPAPLNVLVLGMHRSGTSAVAEALRAAGLDAGPESGLMDPEPQNPMGFGERLDVALFNDRLLASLEWFWDAPDPTPLANPPARPEFVAEGRALVKDLSGPQPFMLKDPRISLLLPWWRQILFDRFVPVIVLRDPEEVAWSLNVRDGFPIELGLALWAAYHRHLAAGLDGMEWIGVDYAALCDKPKAAVSDLLKSLAELGVEAPVDSRAGSRVIRPLLRRATHPKEQAADPEVIAAITALRSQWPVAPITTAAAVGPTTAPSEWEKAILRLHRQTREAVVREKAARTKANELETSLAALSTAHTDLQLAAEALRENGASIRRQLETTSRERDAARTRLAELEARAATLAEQRAEVERGAAQLRTEIASLRQNRENVSRERDIASTSLAELQARFETLSEDRSQLDARFQALGARHAELQLEAIALRHDAAATALERDAARTAFADLEASLAELGTKHVGLESAAASLRQQVEYLNGERDAAKNAFAEVETSLAELGTRHAELESAAASLRQQVEDLNSERVAAHSSVAKLERAVAKQSATGSLLRQEAKFIGRERDAARAGLAELETRLATLDTKHNELNQVATELRGQEALVRQQLEYVSRERDDAQESRLAIEERFASLAAKHAELESRLAKMLAERDVFEQVVSDLRLTVADMEHGEGLLRADNDALRAQVEGVASEREIVRASLVDLEESLTAMNAERDRLELVTAEMRADAATLRQQLENERRERDRLAHERDALAVQRHTLANESEDLRFQQSELRRSVAAAEERLRSADGEIHLLRVKAGDLETQLGTMAAAEAVRAMQNASGGGTVRSALRAFRVTYRRALVHLPQSILGRVWDNPLFDAEWYTKQYPDVTEQRIRPELHFRLHGVPEARNPNPLFETGWYLSQSQDVSRSGLNPLDHYFLFGAAEGRDPSPLFSTGEYILANPDVAAGGMNPLLHYLRFGTAEARPRTRAEAALLEAARTEAMARTEPSGASVEPTNWEAPAAAPEWIAAAVAPAHIEVPADSPATVAPSTMAEKAATTWQPSPSVVSLESAIARVDRPDHRAPVRVADDVRVIALYRSSYYPHSQSLTNAELGSSEWLAVARARPTYPNHQQPRVPGELGFYDLRLPDTRHDQSELARFHGIHAFCYYETWGYPTLHTQPFLEMLSSGAPDFPFTLCLTIDAAAAAPAISTLSVKWLNANRPQLTSALRALLDRRAVKVGADPVLLVEGLPGSSARRVADLLRQEALSVGLPGIFLVAPTTATVDAEAIKSLGVDALLAMHPNRMLLQEHGAHSGNGRSPHTTLLPYEEYVKRSRLVPPSPLRLQTVLSGWDDTPLKGQGGLVLTDSTPESYSEWLRSEVSTARDLLPRDRRFVFVSSWNDWARGAYLEPDIVNGRAYLESTRASLASPVWAHDGPTG